MILDIRPCIEGRTIEFSGEISLPELEFFGERPFTEPVAVNGSVRNRAGILEFDATVSADLRLICGRCAEPFHRVLNLPVSVILAETLNDPEDANEGGIVLIKDGICDIDEIIVPALILEMGIKNLCGEDCRGLCPKCGFNLNNGPCGCEAREIDPRLAKLGEYLEK